MFLTNLFPKKLFRFLAIAIAALSLTVLAACSFPTDTTAGEAPPVIETTSGESEIALAEHLASLEVKKYGAFWCPHCHAQQTLFGKEAFEKITYVECDPEGQNAQPAACQAAGVEGYPSWEINGELYSGVQPLEALAQLSGYTGPTAFTNTAQ